MSIDLTKTAAFAVQDKSIITVDIAQVERRTQEHIRKLNTANPPATEDSAKELQRLRRELFNLTERARNTETYCNEQAGRVRLLEQQTTDAINRKKMAVAAGNALAERNAEAAVKQIEGEMHDARKEFYRAQRVSASAARELNNWPHHARVEQLEKELKK